MKSIEELTVLNFIVAEVHISNQLVLAASTVQLDFILPVTSSFSEGAVLAIPTFQFDARIVTLWLPVHRDTS